MVIRYHYSSRTVLLIFRVASQLKTITAAYNRHRTIATHTLIDEEEEFFDACTFLDFDDVVEDLLDTRHPDKSNNTYTVSLTTVEDKANFDLLRPFFGCAPADTLKKTFEVTTQFARGRVLDTLKQHWRPRFPACNVKRRNDPVAIATVFSDTPAVDGSFVGRESLVSDSSLLP
jgi:hypothetical protein